MTETSDRERPPPSIAGTGGYAAATTLRASAEEKWRYRRLAEVIAGRRRVLTDTIPPRNGRAYVVEAGHILRVSCPEGPQVGDFIAFNRDDPAERFWSARTRVIHGAHLRVGDRLWSCPPLTRPMLTLIADTLDHPALPHGARAHDLLFCRCDARHYELVHGLDGARNCNDNLAEAITPFGLAPSDVHDPFNIFMTTGLNDEGQPFYLPSTSRKGDHVELYAEIPCLVAVSACPGGSSGARSNPLGIEIFAPADSAP